MHCILLVGRNGVLARLSKTFTEKPWLGYRLSATIGSASIREIKEIRKTRGVDEIIVCDPSVPDEEQTKLLDYCQVNNIVYKYLPTTLQTSRFSIRMFEGEPFIEAEHTPLDGWGKILKRTFDIVASALLIVVFSPLMLVVAVLIKLEDPDGPVIYKTNALAKTEKNFLSTSSDIYDGNIASRKRIRILKRRFCMNSSLSPNAMCATTCSTKSKMTLGKRRSVRLSNDFQLTNCRSFSTRFLAQ